MTQTDCWEHRGTTVDLGKLFGSYMSERELFCSVSGLLLWCLPKGANLYLFLSHPSLPESKVMISIRVLQSVTWGPNPPSHLTLLSKVLLKHSNTWLTNFQWPLFSYIDTVKYLWQAYGPLSLKYLLSGPLQKKLAGLSQSSFCMKF